MITHEEACNFVLQEYQKLKKAKVDLTDDQVIEAVFSPKVK